jgi:hypothetical protein
MPTVWTPSGTSAETIVTYACSGSSTCTCGQQDAITINTPTPVTITEQQTAVTFPALAFTYNQNLAASTWVINHNLNFFPNVTVVDSAGSICEGEIQYVDANNLTLTFQAAFSGSAYLS